jgi:HEAT repeat protein
MKPLFLRLVLCAAAMCPSVVCSGQVPKERAWQILHAGVSAGSIEKRAQAIRALGLLPQDREAVSLIRSAMRDDKPDVRTAAATATENMRCLPCMPDLQRL